jgi:hypothetical protein
VNLLASYSANGLFDTTTNRAGKVSVVDTFEEVTSLSNTDSIHSDIASEPTTSKIIPVTQAENEVCCLRIGKTVKSKSDTLSSVSLSPIITVESRPDLTLKQIQVLNERRLFPLVPKSLTKLVGQAIGDFKMIRDGDRVLLGLSGGKDSLTLLHILHTMQKRAPIKFELAAVTMNPNFSGFDPRPLIPYMKSLGIPYYFESQELLEEAQKCDPKSICSWCSRMKRELLFCFT